MGLTHSIKQSRRMKISVNYLYISPNSSKKVLENVCTKLFILHSGIFSANAVTLLPWVLYFSLGFGDSLIEILCSSTKAKDGEFSVLTVKENLCTQVTKWLT